MHKALYPRDNINWLYEPRKEGGRELVNIEDNVYASIRRTENSIKKSKERLITTLAS